ncbi:MMPL family transporter [Virgibacillus dakarensis]|uniref:MMPL family transporter n=1 Tax=Virgibacillus dakarensis TaxID=1917889 RepID=UPI000B44DDBA|nr:MMPL family transporter [Virgibacillus dakarensis]MTW88249.1 MMPL family transporter [Virgibacillus dakarensis]
MDILKRLAKLLTNFPMKSIFISLIIVVLLVFGVRNVFMATGNDTLVESNTDVYQDNLMLEDEFGGESIIVLYESENLLTPETLAHMKGLESALQSSDSIYSMISPVTLVEEIASKQSETFQEGISDIIDGLDEMGSQLSEIGLKLKENIEDNPEMEFPQLGNLQLTELEEPELPELGTTQFSELELPEFGKMQVPDMEGQMTDLNKAFSNMIEAQENLEEGTENLVGGYIEFSEQLNGLGQGLNELTRPMEDSPQKVQLQDISGRLIGLSEKMLQASEGSGQLPTIPDQTIDGLNNIQQNLNKQLQEQKKQLEKQEEVQIQKQQELQKQREQTMQEMQEQQEAQQEEIKLEMQKQKEAQQEKIKTQMEVQKSEKEKEMQEIQEEMQESQKKQIDKLDTLGEGLSTMGEKLQTISENMETIYGYSDIMTSGLPKKQATLDNMIYDDDGNLHMMFEEVIVDESHMLMMIKLKGGTEDTEKSEVIETINSYLDTEPTDSVDTLVSGKPVLDNAIKSSMKESIQKMMGLALLIMIFVLFIVFKVRWRLLPLLTVLIAVIGTVGLMGWLQIPITMVSMAVFPILIGLGIDYAIQFQNRYEEEFAKEDSNE